MSWTVPYCTSLLYIELVLRCRSATNIHQSQISHLERKVISLILSERNIKDKMNKETHTDTHTHTHTHIKTHTQTHTQ